MRALVTGAGARLGQAMALYLGQRGYDVAVHYAGSEAGAADTVAQLRAMGRNAAALQADLLDEDAAQSLIPRAVDALGGQLTVLVNNASIFATLKPVSCDRFGRVSLVRRTRHASCESAFATSASSSSSSSSNRDSNM